MVLRPLMITLLVDLLFTGWIAADDTLKVMTHSVRSAAVRDETLGLSPKLEGGRRPYYIGLVQAIFRKTGKDYVIQEVPLSRGFALLERDDSPIAFFNVVRTEKRDPLFKWVGPISNFKTWFFEHENNPTGIRSMNDARKVNAVCAVRGNSMVAWFEQHGFKNIVQANAYGDCIQLLEYGRVDLIYGVRYQQLAETEERSRKIRRTPVSTKDEDFEPTWANYGSIAFSKSVPEEEIAAWQHALDEIVASGKIETLKARYLVDKNGPPLETKGVAVTY